MSEPLEPEGRPLGAFHLVRLIRRDGPFETFEALEPQEGGARVVALRRVADDVAEREPARGMLIDRSAIARRVAHQNVVLCHGTVEVEGEVVQLSEHVVGLELTSLIAGSSGAPLELPFTVWIVRQMLEAIVHAESLGFTHGGITPRCVHPGAGGALKIDYGLAAGDPDYAAPKMALHVPADVYACAAILFELATGARYADTLRDRASTSVPLRALRADAPEALELLLARTLDPELRDPPRDGKSFASALERVFYVELDGDDARHGEVMLRAALGGLDLLATAALPPDETSTRKKGAFTQMLEERAAPVVPKPLSADDRDSALMAPDSSWVPGREVPSRSAETVPGVAAEEATAGETKPLLADPVVEDVAPDPAAAPALEAPLAPPLTDTGPQPVAPDPSSSEAPELDAPQEEKRPWYRRVSWLWFSIGFAATWGVMELGSDLMPPATETHDDEVFDDDEYEAYDEYEDGADVISSTTSDDQNDVDAPPVEE